MLIENAPRVSVIVPAFRSGVTMRASLASIVAQSFRDFEVIVIESSGDSESAAMVAREFPSVRYFSVGQQMLPQAARNLGVRHARGSLLVFTDPDIYVVPHWLQSLVRGWEEEREVIIGSFACHDSRWLDLGVHFTKFSKWLPAGERREVDIAPSGNMLVSRDDFERAGRFPGELFVGDVELSRRLQMCGSRLLFEPSAVGAHHHLHSFGSFCVERFERGRWYGELRSEWYREKPWRVALLIAATVLPVRLFTNVGHVLLHALRAGELVRALATLPLIIAGHASALIGELSAYLPTLRRQVVDWRVD